MVYHTNDGGENWEQQITGLNAIVQQNQIFALNQMKAWIAGAYGWISITGNGGNTWTPIQTGFTTSMNWDIQFIDNMHGWMIGDGTLYTDDGGLNWERISSGFGFSIHFINDNQGWMTNHWGRISHTVDGGYTWQQQNILTSYSLYDICFTDENNGWAVGDYGIILHTNNGGTVGTGEFKVQSSRFKVECYPNPFHSAVSLEYTLENAAIVTLDIYNINGQLVDCLVNSHQDIGIYQINWEAGLMPAGVYFYKLNLGELSTSGRLILIR
jgi:hypothetical protein